MSSYDYMLKFISVGDSGVGKSCLLLRLINKEFQQTETTIGIEFGTTTLTIQQKQIKLQIWDTAGQESFKSISRAYYRNAIGCLLVFDMTRRETFMHLLDWLKDVHQHGNDQIKTILVANKSDCKDKRQDEAREFAKTHNLLYIETSAKSGENVLEVFQEITTMIYNSLDLSRDLQQFSETDIKRLEMLGVKVGPRRPLVLVSPPSTSSGCC